MYAKAKEMEEKEKEENLEAEENLREDKKLDPFLYAFINAQKKNFTPKERHKIFSLARPYHNPCAGENMFIVLKMIGLHWLHCEDDSDCTDTDSSE